MAQQRQPTHIGDDDIIALADALGALPVMRQKNDNDFMRDGLYYGRGYLAQRLKGFTHEEAQAEAIDAARTDGRYDVDSTGVMPPLGDDKIIDVAAAFTARYRDVIGRFQRQTRTENLRDGIFYLNRYIDHRRRGRNHERAIREMEREMNAEAGLPDPYPSGSAGRGSQHEPQGVVRGERRRFVDDHGAFFPLGASMFWAPWGWAHDRERTERNIEFLAQNGIDYVRIFGEVGGPTWADRTIDPRDEDYEARMGDLLDTLYDKYGMRAELTVFAGGTGADPDLTVDKILNVIRPRQHTILNLEGANESFANFPDINLLSRLVRRLRSDFPGLVGFSSPGARFDDIRDVHLKVANMFILHSERAWSDGGWRAVRQPWDAKDFTVPGSNNEPPGLQSSVGQLEDPLRLTMLRAVGIMCGMAAFVLHTGAGTRGGGAADLGTGKPYLPRKSNFWEYETFTTIVSALRSVDGIIPEHAPNWRKTRHHWDDHPLRTDDIWPDGLGHGVVRNHCAYEGGTFVTMPIGIRRFVDLRAKDRCSVSVYEPTTGDLVREETVNAGQRLHLDGADDSDASKAYIIVGQR